MTSYWDAASVVPLLIPETMSDEMITLFRSETTVFTWWGTAVECESALARRAREGLGERIVIAAMARLMDLRATWTEVQPGSDVRESAVRLLWSHPLRAADALQLAAALQAADGTPQQLAFVSLDARLRLAAEREGLPVIGGPSIDR